MNWNGLMTNLLQYYFCSNNFLFFPSWLWYTLICTSLSWCEEAMLGNCEIFHYPECIVHYNEPLHCLLFINSKWMVHQNLLIFSLSLTQFRLIYLAMEHRKVLVLNNLQWIQIKSEKLDFSASNLFCDLSLLVVK